MYYYIFEQSTNSAQKRLNKKIKELCADAGIAGETVSPSPARTIEELAQIGSSKGYSTVVAVGSDGFFNKVASSLINHNRQKQEKDKKIVLGFVPWYPEKSYISGLMGLQSHNQSVETLKYRKLTQMTIGVVSPNKYFVSPITIHLTKPSQVRITTQDFDTSLALTDLAITKNLTLTCFDANYTGSVFQKTVRWLFGKPTNNPSESIFRHKQFTIESSQPLAVTVEGETIAKTPITVSQSLTVLHTISSRDKILSK